MTKIENIEFQIYCQTHVILLNIILQFKYIFFSLNRFEHHQNEIETIWKRSPNYESTLHFYY